MELNPQFDNEEKNFLINYTANIWPKIEPTITEITTRLALEYFGIDCYIKDDGNILAFEINANMNVLINTEQTPNRWEQPIEAIRQAVIALIKRKAQFS
jgi:glutathione synthase/RimK-type ligase-like ATP-grasp enzyme